MIPKFDLDYLLKEPNTGARTLHGITRSDGTTDLLLGGKGLWYFTPKISSITASLQLLTLGLAFASIQKLSVQQRLPGFTSIFALSTDLSIAALTRLETEKLRTSIPGTPATATTPAVPPIRPVQVVPPGQGGDFAGFSSSFAGVVETVVVADRLGNLQLFEEHVASGTWRAGDMLWS